MPEFVTSPTEQTTAATDLLLGLAAMVFCHRLIRGPERTQVRWWAATFGFLAVASLLGAVAHGLALAPIVVERVWLVLNGALALTMAVLTLAVWDDWGKSSGAWVPAASFSAAGVFYLVTLAIPDSFLMFILYEAIVMIWALLVYVALVRRGTLPGARWLAAGIGATIAAAVVQASGPYEITLAWVFDHNGIFHLIQLAGCACLFRGVSLNLRTLHAV